MDQAQGHVHGTNHYRNSTSASRSGVHKERGCSTPAMTYNVFTMSVLSFISQLEDPPEAAHQIEEKGLKGAAEGPHLWAMPAALWHLSDPYGQAQLFQSLWTLAWASKVKVAAIENQSCK